MLSRSLHLSDLSKSSPHQVPKKKPKQAAVICKEVLPEPSPMVPQRSVPEMSLLQHPFQWEFQAPKMEIFPYIGKTYMVGSSNLHRFLLHGHWLFLSTKRWGVELQPLWKMSFAKEHLFWRPCQNGGGREGREVVSCRVRSLGFSYKGEAPQLCSAMFVGL